MKIDGSTPLRGSQPTRKARSAGGSGEGFADSLQRAAGASAPTGAAPPAPVTSISALLAIQEVDPDQENRRQAVTRGHVLLDGLDRLRMAILDGEVDETELRAIAADLAEHRPDLQDEALSEILDEIETRALVELAKRGIDV